MPTIFIDTNIVMNENFFRSATAQAFLKACLILNIEVVVPEAVYDEILGNFPKKIKERFEVFEKAQKELSKFLDLDLTEISLEDEVEDFEEWLIKLFEDNGVVIAPYPDVSGKELIEKAYAGRKPFKNSGEGYKDYIIWKTIKVYIEQKSSSLPNLFITNNVKDFSEKDDGVLILHSDLANQIQEFAKKPKLYSSLKSVLDNELMPNLQGISLGDLPDIDAEDISNLTEEFLLGDLPDYSAFGFENVPFSNDVMISGVGDYEIDEILLTKVDDEIVIKVTGTVEIAVEGFVDKFAYYHDEISQVNVDDADWNDHVMAVSTFVKTAFDLNIFYSLKEKEIIDHKISLPQEIVSDWY